MSTRKASNLNDQLARAAISVHANLVEGAAHQSPKEFARFLKYAIASSSELEAHLHLAHDLGYLGGSQFVQVIERVENVRKMLYGLLKHAQRRGAL